MKYYDGRIAEECAGISARILVRRAGLSLYLSENPLYRRISAHFHKKINVTESAEAVVWTRAPEPEDRIRW